MSFADEMKALNAKRQSIVKVSEAEVYRLTVKPVYACILKKIRWNVDQGRGLAGYVDLPVYIDLPRLGIEFDQLEAKNTSWYEAQRPGDGDPPCIKLKLVSEKSKTTFWSNTRLYSYTITGFAHRLFEDVQALAQKDGIKLSLQLFGNAMKPIQENEWTECWKDNLRVCYQIN